MIDVLQVKLHPSPEIELASAFQTAALFAPSRSPKPILQNVKLDVTKTGAIFMATDMEVGVRIAVDYGASSVTPCAPAAGRSR